MVCDARSLLGYPQYRVSTSSVIEWNIPKLGKRQLLRYAFINPRTFESLIAAMEAHGEQLDVLLDEYRVLVEAVSRVLQRISIL